MWVVLNSKSTSWNPVERLIFPAPTASYDLSSFPEELILIPRADGEQVPCLLLPFRHARFLIIYFHANAEDLGLCYSFCKIMRDLFQVHVLAVEYPGYGVCPGRTDEDGIMANAMAAMRFATDSLHWPCDGIKLFGRSLGTGPTVALATQYEVAGVILVSPFTSIRELFRSQVGVLAEFVCDRFRNHELAEKIESPTLIVHGQQDTLIPLEHGKLVYENLCTRKMMVCPAAMGHNTSLLKSIGTFVLPMTQFFSLPDYTFEDIEVPAWVYPANHRAAAAPQPCPQQQEEQDASGPKEELKPTCHKIPAIKGLNGLRAGGPLAEPALAAEEEEAYAAQRPKRSPRASPRSAEAKGPGATVVAATGQGPSQGGPVANGLSASGNYDFKGSKTARTASLGPPDAVSAALEEDNRPLTAREPLTQAGALASRAEKESLPKDLLAAIDTRITWMVESTGLGKKQPPQDSRGRSAATTRLTNLISVEDPSSAASMPPGSFAL